MTVSCLSHWLFAVPELLNHIKIEIRKLKSHQKMDWRVPTYQVFKKLILLALPKISWNRKSLQNQKYTILKNHIFLDFILQKRSWLVKLKRVWVFQMWNKMFYLDFRRILNANIHFNFMSFMDFQIWQFVSLKNGNKS